ncbi:SDR family oxidoreductase (plasmid) [Rhodococcus ruber]|uniref:SDR family NAD(P)-dependent oxidoreductase n=1 Tax=Rhodococcus ruber TaxID=1830 RepID=UPI00265A1EE5|nr:SDR family oxidoreductase [Rhodococcus ruber]WKK14873.1 SDR family oxidoreductase [Rhodococcus ruber]
MNSAVLVTGGASGIGRATVARFLERGWGVVVADANPAAGQSLLEESAGDRPGMLRFVHTDVTDEDAVERAVAHVSEVFGRIDCVVNNAGIGGAFGPITDIDVADWDETFAVLTRGVFLGIKHGARALIDQGSGGAIVNTSSVGGLVGGGAPQAYSAAKAAVVSLGQSTAAELAVHRIRVNTVCPGVIVTPLIGDNPQKVQSALQGVQPWPEVGQPHEVADLIAWLAGPESSFVTGAAIPIDGGLTAAGIRLGNSFGNNVGLQGLVGLNRGTTGGESVVRRRVG